MTVLMLSSAFVAGVYFLSSNSTADPVTQNYTVYKYYQGYLGNNTIYLTTGLQNNPRSLSKILGNGNKTTTFGQNNTASVVAGLNVSTYNGNNGVFGEYYETKPYNKLYITIPVYGAGATNRSEVPEGNFSEPGVEVYDVTQLVLSTNISGMPGANSYFVSDYASGFNVSELNYSQKLNDALMNTWSYVLGPVKYVGFGISTLSYFESISGAIPRKFANDSVAGNNPLNVPFSVVNGTWHTTSGGASIGQNVYGASMYFTVTIPKTNFSHRGFINLSAQNMLQVLSDGVVLESASGAHSQISLPTAPAITLNGTVKVGNARAKNQEILISQLNKTTNVTVANFTEMTSNTGQYQFYGEPGYAYSIQAVTPYRNLGYANTSYNIAFNDYGEKILNLNLTSGYIDFKESGLPSGASWSVATPYGTYSTTSSSQVILQPSGTHQYDISTSDDRYAVSPSSVSLDVNVTSQVQDITFTKKGNITFQENGLSGQTWSVTFDGKTESTSSSSIEYTISQGTYSFSVGAPSNYQADPSSGSVTVSGSGVTINVRGEGSTTTMPGT